MAVSIAHSKASTKWNAKQDNIMIRPDKQEGARIRYAAKQSEYESLQKYILAVLREKMDADGIPQEVPVEE